MLAIRAFICEKTWPTAGIFFDICFCLCFLLYILIDPKLRVSRKYFIYPLIYSGLLLLNTFFSVNSYNSQNEIVKLWVYMLIFYFVYWQNQKNRRLLIGSICAISLFISLRAIYQYAFGLEYIKQHYAYAQIVEQGFYALEMLKQKRVVSWFLSPNLLAGYLVMIAPLAGAYGFESFKQQKINQSIFFTLIFICSAVGLYFTGSWGAYLGFAIAMLFIILNPLGNKTALIESRKKNNKLILGGVFFLLILAALFSQRAKYFIDLANPQNSLVQRLYYSQAAVKMIKENPLTGIGLGNFGLVYPQFKQINANETIYAHNIFLQLWAELGTIIFICFIFFAIYLLSRFLKKLRQQREVGLIAASLAFLVYNFFDYSLMITQSGYVFFIVIACLFKPQEDSYPEKNNRFTPDNFLNKTSFIVICGVMIMFLTAEYCSLRSLDKADQFLKQGQTDKALVLANTALKFRVNNDQIYYFIAVCYQQKAGKLFSPTAAAYYCQAIRLNPKYAFYYAYLGDYYFSHKLYPQAKKAYQQAIKHYPHNKKFKEIYSQIQGQ